MSTWSAGFGSIRNRIVIGYVVLIAVALIITLLVARVALVSRLDHDIDTRLADEVAQLEVIVAEGNPDTGAGFADAASLFDIHLRRVLPDDDGAFYTLVDGDPYLLSFDAPLDLSTDPDVVDAWATVESSTFDTIDSTAGPVRLLIVPVELEANSGTFVAATFTRDARSELDDVFRVLALVGTLVLLASALIALTIAARVIRPIRELTAVTTSITDADLSARLPVDGDDEIAELSKTFNAMMARLEAGFASQRSFLDDVAHELRTPITIIQGHLDVLGDDPVEREETKAVLTDELIRMNRYVDDLLVLAQAERPDFLRLAETDLDVMLDSIMAKVPGLGFREWVVESRFHASAMLDEQRIVQAVLNLAQNAVRHSDDGSRIGIGMAEAPDATSDDGRSAFRVWVSDAGTGVDPAIVDALFERHIRSASSRSDGGVGLGLSIVDAIAVAHGGRVFAEPTDREGATFTIELPAAEISDDSTHRAAP